MARPKNYTKLLEVMQRRLQDTEAKYASAEAELKKLKNDRAQLRAEYENLRLEALQHLMDDRGLTLDELSELIQRRTCTPA